MNKNSTMGPSKREQLRVFYDTINQTAKPGDIVFFISERRNAAYSILSRLYRKWQGFAYKDTTVWHTAIYVGPRKESKGAQWRPHIIHAIKRGVEEIYIPPSFFSSIREDPAGEPIQKGRIEIIQHPKLKEAQRGEIVNYARAQLGKQFADLSWRHDVLTYAFGLSPARLAPEKVSCHGLAFSAYKNVGVSFPHQLGHVPFFNVAKYIGYPLGQPPKEVDVTRLYLRDHHFYRDPRFVSILAIFEDDETKRVTAVPNPGKYQFSKVWLQILTYFLTINFLQISLV